MNAAQIVHSTATDYDVIVKWKDFPKDVCLFLKLRFSPYSVTSLWVTLTKGCDIYLFAVLFLLQNYIYMHNHMHLRSLDD